MELQNFAFTKLSVPVIQF